jgi:hypothetical protein
MVRNRVVLRSLCALVVIAGFGIGSRASAAILQTLEFEGHTYHLLAAKWWHESEEEAASLGGHLVTINSAAEHDFIYNNFGPTAIAHAPETGKVNLWLGLCDPLMDDGFEWCDGATVDYLNFFPDQPQKNHDDEMFIGIRVRGRSSSVPVGKWIDIVSDTRLGDLNFGVVEVIPVPEPALGMLLVSGAVFVMVWSYRGRNRPRTVCCPVAKLPSLTRRS